MAKRSKGFGNPPKTRNAFKQACYSYFSDSDLVDWIWNEWEKEVPRQLIYKILRKMQKWVTDDPDHDWRCELSKHFGFNRTYTIGIDMSEQRVWISNPSVWEKPFVKLSARGPAILDLKTLYSDWKKTISDFQSGT